jgi:hypothetical protein
MPVCIIINCECAVWCGCGISSVLMPYEGVTFLYCKCTFFRHAHLQIKGKKDHRTQLKC